MSCKSAANVLSYLANKTNRGYGKRKGWKGRRRRKTKEERKKTENESDERPENERKERGRRKKRKKRYMIDTEIESRRNYDRRDAYRTLMETGRIACPTLMTTDRNVYRTLLATDRNVRRTLLASLFCVLLTAVVSAQAPMVRLGEAVVEFALKADGNNYQLPIVNYQFVLPEVGGQANNYQSLCSKSL